MDENNQIQLTDKMIDRIAEKAAERALEKVYADVGKTVVRRLFWLVGAAALAIVGWLGAGNWPK